ncbi:8-demethyl-8-(2, 3-dimethoxy-alpha-L-rhamnosyl)-tetracenomycin-C 4'-O-methyltransferase [Methylophilaceae bacterium]|nr:8-demethyl-8-(2, 3-dimethoxy-alpha-L-rhamnosyl)-tetracenomycin-C 4'-O-methyltransferase [Methylophilaceae bacterium]
MRAYLYKAFYTRLLGGYRKLFSQMPTKLKLNYSQDGLYTIHNTSFIEDSKFKHAYDMAKATGSWGGADVEWRVHISLWLSLQAARLEGDFVECGTNRGGIATAILTYLAESANFQSKTFYCFDTFEGLSKKYSSVSEYENTLGHYSDCFADVQKHFAKYPQVKLIKGAIPETLVDFKCSKVAFIHIDMNCAIPEIAAAEFFWPYLVSGGYMLLDDFAWEACGEQRQAFVEFAKKHQIEILWIPTGQGLIQKP